MNLQTTNTKLRELWVIFVIGVLQVEFRCGLQVKCTCGVCMWGLRVEFTDGVPRWNLPMGFVEWCWMGSWVKFAGRVHGWGLQVGFTSRVIGSGAWVR